MLCPHLGGAGCTLYYCTAHSIDTFVALLNLAGSSVTYTPIEMPHSYRPFSEIITRRDGGNVGGKKGLQVLCHVTPHESLQNLQTKL